MSKASNKPKHPGVKTVEIQSFRTARELSSKTGSSQTERAAFAKSLVTESKARAHMLLSTKRAALAD